jgi:hypothetical protein
MEKAPCYHLVGDLEDKALAELKAKEKEAENVGH